MNPLLLEGIFNLGKGLIDKFFPDPALKAQAQLDLLKMQQTGELAELASSTQLANAQIQVNLAEASSGDKFAADWRPFIGWTCGFAFAYAAIFEPLMRFVAKVGFAYVGAFPDIDTNITMQVLLGILGLGAMRSTEKIKGVA